MDLQNDLTECITTDNCYKEIDDSCVSEDVCDSITPNTDVDVIVADDKNIFCKKVNVDDFKNINKMKLDELRNLATKYGIPLQDNVKGKLKNRTKIQLIVLLKQLCEAK